MGDEKIKKIVEEKWPNKLSYLSLGTNLKYLETNCLTSIGFGRLSQHKWEQLKVLNLGMTMNNLGNNEIDDKGLIFLKKFSALTELDLSSNRIKGKGLKSLS